MSEFFVYPEDMSDYEETTDTFITSTKDNLPKIEKTNTNNTIFNETKYSVQNQTNEKITKKNN